MSDELDELEAMANQEKKKSGKKDDKVYVKLTGDDADILRSFRKGKPMQKTGKSLVESNGARLKSLIADKIADDYHGINKAPTSFVLMCDPVPEKRDPETDKVISPAKPAAECKISIKPDSYVTHHGLDRDVIDRISEITHDPLLEEGEPQFVDRHFTKVISPVIVFNAIPPVLRKETLSAITRLKNLSVEIRTEEGTKTITMPEDAIQIIPKWFDKSSLHDARRMELDKATNKRFESEGLKTSSMIS